MSTLLAYSMAMIRLNIHEVKNQFSKYVELVEGGETVVVCKRNLPVVEIRPIRKLKQRKPVLGAAKGRFKITSSFYKPLPESLLRAFEGEPKARQR